MTVKPHECIHEEMLLGQSRAIERLDAELGYKKERLDELKKDNEKMQNMLNTIQSDVSKILLKSKQDDDYLKDIISKQDNRITALETTNKTLKWTIGIGFTVLGVAIGGLGLLLSILH